MSGWPDPARPGIPAQPDNSQWHIVRSILPKGTDTPAAWDAGRKTWYVPGFAEIEPERAGRSWHYVSPVHTAAQLAAAEQRGAERERAQHAADVAAAVEAAREACARLAIELTAAPGQKNAKSEWRAQIGQEIAAAIRARGGSDAP